MTVAESKEMKRKREDARTKTNCHGASQDETSETIQSDMIEWEEFKQRQREADDEMRAVAAKLFNPDFHPSIFLRECRDDWVQTTQENNHKTQQTDFNLKQNQNVNFLARGLGEAVFVGIVIVILSVITAVVGIVW